jgi:hypothetical protein
LEKEEAKREKYRELRQQIEVTMRLEDEEKAKDDERLTEMRQMSAERKKAKARLM